VCGDCACALIPVRSHGGVKDRFKTIKATAEAEVFLIIGQPGSTHSLSFIRAQSDKFQECPGYAVGVFGFAGNSGTGFANQVGGITSHCHDDGFPGG
jgi:hypothetical protein